MNIEKKRRIVLGTDETFELWDSDSVTEIFRFMGATTLYAFLIFELRPIDQAVVEDAAYLLQMDRDILSYIHNRNFLLPINLDTVKAHRLLIDVAYGVRISDTPYVLPKSSDEMDYGLIVYEEYKIKDGW